ncbi:MAG TPA: hypothetical protein VH542_11395 [Steroidobacteraceae bacterium]
MFKIRKLSPGALSLLLATASAAPTAHAANDNPWGLQFFVGDSAGTEGDFASHRTTQVPDLGVFDPALSGTSGNAAFNSLRYDDIYRSRYVLGAEVSYDASENLEAYGRFSYNPLDGQTHTIGLLTTSDQSVSEPITAHFKDADQYSLMLGSRYYVPTGDQWRVFAGAALGASRFDDMTGTIDLPTAGVSMPDLRFARATTVFSQSLEAGIAYHSPASVDLQFSIGADHMDGPKGGDDATLAALGFDTTRDGGDRWSFPITLGATYRF